MSDQIPVKEKVESPLPSMQAAEAVDRVKVFLDFGKRMLRGLLLKVLCCGAPFLLILAIPLFGISLSGFLWPLVILVAMLACPLGTYLMMRTMTKN